MISMPFTSPISTRILIALIPIVLLFAPFSNLECGELSGSLQGPALSGNDETVRVLVFFDDDIQKEVLKSIGSSDLSRTVMHRAAFSELKENSISNNDRFQKSLNNSNLNVRLIKNFWITDAALVEVKASELTDLAELDMVSYIAPDTTLALIEPASIEAAPGDVQGSEDNLYTINADKLWVRGLTGKGRIIGSFDTGVQGDHPALISKWRGNYIDDATAAWFDPYGSTYPADDNGHGTHVMGIMVGSTEDDTIGVAFDAQWISASVIDRGSGLSKTISDILSAFEWAADPDGDPSTIDDVPDVICHSWGIPQGIFPACDNTFWSAIDNLETLGVVCIFAAGNEGPDSMSIRFPADRAGTPLNGFCVGAVDQTSSSKLIASFSSRGPSSCNEDEIKPEVVAPGVSIRSSYKGSTYKYISGTSMAAPHVAAAVALIREYNPEVTVEQIKEALFQSAVDLGASGEDNLYGNGLIDLEAALALIPPPDSPQIEVVGFTMEDGNDDIIQSGEQFSLEVEITSQYALAGNVWAEIFISSDLAEINTDSSYFGTIDIDETGNNSSNPFEITLFDEIKPGGALPVDINFHDVYGNTLASRRLEIIVAQSQNAAYYTLSNGTISLTVDNYGGIGHGVNSPCPVGAVGFSPYQSQFDILPEFSLLVAKEGESNVSDASRSEEAFVSDNDFMASREYQADLDEPGSFGSVDFVGRYNDSLASTPMGLSITQRTSIFDETDLQNCVIIEYSIRPEYARTDDTYYIGFLMDWDMGDDGSGIEKCGYDLTDDFSYYYNQDDDLYVGVRFLNRDIQSFKIIPNVPGEKSLLSDADKYSHLSSTEIMQSVEKWNDYFSIISTSAGTSSAFDSIKVALAVVVGTSMEDLRVGLARAFEEYNIVTSVDDITDNTVVPTSFELNQNYPNPFNMSTNISFNLATAGKVKLEVFNILGQTVAVLADGEYPAGPVTVTWDGRDKNGKEIASGTYLYRLTVDGEAPQVKKLSVLK